MRDFSFDLIFNETFNCVKAQDHIIDDLIDFAVSNNISYCGAIGLGACFAAEKPFNIELIKNRFIEFVKKDYNGKVSVIIFRDLNEDTGEFFNIEKI